MLLGIYIASISATMAALVKSPLYKYLYFMSHLLDLVVQGHLCSICSLMNISVRHKDLPAPKGYPHASFPHLCPILPLPGSQLICKLAHYFPGIYLYLYFRQLLPGHQVEWSGLLLKALSTERIFSHCYHPDSPERGNSAATAHTESTHL